MKNTDKIKTIGYMPLFYGKEYIKESLLSVVNHVDKFVILYTQRPSQGQSDDLKPLDTEEELKTIAEAVLGNKLVWDTQEQYDHENAHRNAIYNFITDEDVLLTLDADEVFDEITLGKTIEAVHNSNVRYFGVKGFINFWRSFNVYFEDTFEPIRFINLKNEAGQGIVHQTVYHFSCAQDIKTIKYKWTVSGHKHELKQEWFDTIYNKPIIKTLNNYISYHPVSYDIWKDPKLFDVNLLSQYLKEHVNFNKYMI